MRSLSLILMLAAGPLSAQAAAAGIEFNRDIRPILSNNCFVCHGPDNHLRKAKLRLDRAHDAAGVRGGLAVLVAGKPQESELYKRITSSDPDEHMPPKKSNKELTRDQIDLIRRWIEEGGKYQGHWSLLSPVKAVPPAPTKAGSARNPLDLFVMARLKAENLSPAPEADRRT